MMATRAEESMTIFGKAESIVAENLICSPTIEGWHLMPFLRKPGQPLCHLFRIGLRSALDHALLNEVFRVLINRNSACLSFRSQPRLHIGLQLESNHEFRIAKAISLRSGRSGRGRP